MFRLIANWITAGLMLIGVGGSSAADTKLDVKPAVRRIDALLRGQQQVPVDRLMLALDDLEAKLAARARTPCDTAGSPTTQEITSGPYVGQDPPAVALDSPKMPFDPKEQDRITQRTHRPIDAQPGSPGGIEAAAGSQSMGQLRSQISELRSAIQSGAPHAQLLALWHSLAQSIDQNDANCKADTDQLRK